MPVDVIPNNDEREHEFGADCWCQPDVEWVDEQTGLPHLNGPIYAHNSADCREFAEHVCGEGVSPDKNWLVFTG